MDVYPSHPDPQHRYRRALLHASASAQRAHCRGQSPTDHAAQSGPALPCGAGAVAGAVRTHRATAQCSVRFSLAVECPAALEREAQRCAGQYLAQHGQAREEPTAGQSGQAPEVQAVDVDSLTLAFPRSVGVEQVGLWAMQQVGFVPLLEELGLSGPQRAAVVGSVIGRMAAPASERATYQWLCERSGLGELLDVDYEAMPAIRLYRASDLLQKHQSRIERHLFSQVSDLFDLSSTVTLYDLTNTYFEGEVADNPKAKRGHSKEKRSDCAAR